MNRILAPLALALFTGAALACPDGKMADASAPAFGDKAAAAQAPTATPVPSQAAAKAKLTKPTPNSATATTKKPSTGG